MFHRKEAEPLVGVFSRAWAFEPSLPGVCRQDSKLRCGVLKTQLSYGLRKFLELPRKRNYLVNIGVSAQDGNDESTAQIFVATEGASATFLVRAKKQKKEERMTTGLIRHLRVERTFRDGTGDIEPVAEEQKVYVEALKSVLRLLDDNIKKLEQPSLCRTCPAQKNSLPRLIV